MILPSPGVAGTLRKSHGVSRLVGRVVGTPDLLAPECHRVGRGSRWRAVRKAIIRSALRAAAPGLALGQTRDTKSAQEIAQLQRSLNTAPLKNDVATVNRLYAPELFTVTAAGVRMGIGNQRKQVNTNANGDVMEDVELDKPRIRVYGDTAVSIYARAVALRTSTGTPRRAEIVTSHVWVRRDAGWQPVLSHTTSASPSQVK